MFAAVSTALWDNGAACGRNYIVRCLSGTGNRPCKQGNIVVQVVDKCPQNPCRATLLLSKDAFNALSRSPTAKLNVEYAQYDMHFEYFSIYMILFLSVIIKLMEKLSKLKRKKSNSKAWIYLIAGHENAASVVTDNDISSAVLASYSA